MTLLFTKGKTLSVIAKELLDLKPDEYTGKVAKERKRREIAMQKWYVKCDQLLMIYLSLYRKYKIQSWLLRRKPEPERLCSFSPSRISKMFGDTPWIRQTTNTITAHFFDKIEDAIYSPVDKAMKCPIFQPKKFIPYNQDFRDLTSLLYHKNKHLLKLIIDKMYDDDDGKTLESELDNETKLAFLEELITSGAD